MQAKDFAPGQLSAVEAASRQSPQTATFNLEAKARPAPRVEAFVEASAADSSYAEEALPAPSTLCSGEPIHCGRAVAWTPHWAC
jgi:hypothetical protein